MSENFLGLFCHLVALCTFLAALLGVVVLMIRCVLGSATRRFVRLPLVLFILQVCALLLKLATYSSIDWNSWRLWYWRELFLFSPYPVLWVLLLTSTRAPELNTSTQSKPSILDT